MAEKVNIIGAHVSVSGGLYKCFENALAICANGVQIFGASPRQWSAKIPNKAELDKFFSAQKSSKIKDVFLHAAYLVNLGTPKPDLYQKSITNLATHLQIANALAAKGLIFHVGSFKDAQGRPIENVAKAIKEVLKLAPGKASLIIENSAGSGDTIGVTPQEIGAILKAVNSPRVKVCIDTAHAFASGLLEKFTPQELSDFKERCEESFGLSNLVALHVNDSKVPFNAKKDRHDNIGQGYIGLSAFQNLANDEFFSNIPWLLEVPGYDNEGPDKENIETVRGLFPSQHPKIRKNLRM